MPYRQRRQCRTPQASKLIIFTKKNRFNFFIQFFFVIFAKTSIYAFWRLGICAYILLTSGKGYKKFENSDILNQNIFPNILSIFPEVSKNGDVSSNFSRHSQTPWFSWTSKISNSKLIVLQGGPFKWKVMPLNHASFWSRYLDSLFDSKSFYPGFNISKLRHKVAYWDVESCLREESFEVQL